jgi:hypothetical protein
MLVESYYIDDSTPDQLTAFVNKPNVKEDEFNQ